MMTLIIIKQDEFSALRESYSWVEELGKQALQKSPVI